jgi:PCFT/HCP family folate transporter-like MFS transporter 1/3
MDPIPGDSWGQKIVHVLGLISIEPAIFLQTFTWGLQMVITQNLIIEKVCRDLDYSEEVCAKIDNFPEADNAVQTRVSELNMALTMLSSLPSIVLALFIGPWSDKNGRKPLMLIPLFGFLLSTFVWMLNVHYMDWPAKYLLGTAIYSFFGGITCLLIGMYSYLADVTSLRSRTTRIGLLDIFLFAGIPSGTFLSAYIFKYFGYYGIFLSVLVIQILCILYVLIKIKDTRGPGSDYCYPDSEMDTVPTSTVRRYLSIVDFHQLFDVFRVSFKRREHNLRRVIVILIFLMLLNVTIFSDGGITYLYARKEFKWDEQKFTKFQTCVIIVSAVAAFIVMPLLSFYWKVHDATIGILATSSKVLSLVVMSLAWNGWVLFLGACLGFLSAFASIVIRSMLSKCVNKSDLGKIYSLLASLEAAVPLFAAPLFTIVYTSTLDTFPGSVFLVQAALFVLAGIGFSYVYFLLTRSGHSFSQLLEESEDLQQNILRSENSENSEITE